MARCRLEERAKKPMNPFVYCTMVGCSDREWDNMGEVGVVMLGLLLVVGVIGGIVSFFNKDKKGD